MLAFMPTRKLRIIGASPTKVRLSCDVCGAHSIYEKDRLRESALCMTCGEYREVFDRRQRDGAHTPERRVALR